MRMVTNVTSGNKRPSIAKVAVDVRLPCSTTPIRSR